MDKIYFQWHITDICNFRCRHCYQDKFTPESELDIEGLKEVSDRIIEVARKQEKKIIVNITGGEPFLKKEIFELLSYLDCQKEIFHLAIITNGSLINRGIIRRLKIIKKLRQIKISLDGADATSNDSLRGKGSFDKAMQAIGLLKEDSALEIIIMLTVMKSNLNQVRGVFNLCQKLELDGLIIERFFPLGEGKRIVKELLGYSGWRSLVRQIFELTNNSFAEEDVANLRAFWIKLSKRQTKLRGASCNISKNAFCIMPDAAVFPCRRFNLKIGNLLEEPWDKILNSELLGNIITAQKKGRCSDCGIPGCRGCAALSYLLSSDYLFEDAQCFYKRDLFHNFLESRQEV